MSCTGFLISCIMLKPWKELETEIEYSCSWFRVQRTKLESPRNQAQHNFYHLLQHDFVNIIALTPEGDFVLIRQFRHSVNRIDLETPGGVIDASDPSPLEAAKRELKEETGYISNEWHELGRFYANPAVSNNTGHAFLALNAEKSHDTDLDLTEDLETVILSRIKVIEAIDKNEIMHGITLSSLLKFEYFRGSHPELFSL